MTAGYLMERLREVRSAPFDAQTLYDALSRLESMISVEVLHLGPVCLNAGEDAETELLVRPPYSGMYLHYLCAELDLMMQEYQSANTEMTVFNGLYAEYAKWFRRTHCPEPVRGVKGYV